jgi:hypothetical protein
MVQQLSEAQLDWRRSNVSVWGDVIGAVVTDENGKQSVTPKSSRQAIDGTIRFLRERTGLAEFLDDEGADDRGHERHRRGGVIVEGRPLANP